jgi:hypothetical protein
MIDRDREAFAAQITYLAEAFAERISPIRIGAYFDALKTYEIEYVRGAVDECIKGSKFFPKPAELIEQCSALRGAFRRALAAETLRKALPAAAAGDEDLCGEIVNEVEPCLRTVAEHRSELHKLLEDFNSPERMERLRRRPSLLERRGIHPPRPGIVITPEEDLR